MMGISLLFGVGGGIPDQPANSLERPSAFALATLARSLAWAIHWMGAWSVHSVSFSPGGSNAVPGLPILLYLASAGVSLWLMYMTGCSLPSEYWDKTAPKPVSDASIWRMKGKEKSSAWSTGWVLSVVFKPWKALSVSTVRKLSQGAFFIRSVEGKPHRKNQG